LDDVVRGRTAVLTARLPDPDLVQACRRDGLLLVHVGPGDVLTEAGPQAVAPRSTTGLVDDPNRLDVRLAGPDGGSGLGALLRNPRLAVLVRPDRVVAAVDTAGGSPRVPWSVRPAYVAVPS
jgi:hypothetical protein